jgi:hypothetical protein
LREAYIRSNVRGLGHVVDRIAGGFRTAVEDFVSLSIISEAFKAIPPELAESESIRQLLQSKGSPEIVIARLHVLIEDPGFRAVLAAAQDAFAFTKATANRVKEVDLYLTLLRKALQPEFFRQISIVLERTVATIHRYIQTDGNPGFRELAARIANRLNEVGGFALTVANNWDAIVGAYRQVPTLSELIDVIQQAFGECLVAVKKYGMENVLPGLRAEIAKLCDAENKIVMGRAQASTHVQALAKFMADRKRWEDETGRVALFFNELCAGGEQQTMKPLVLETESGEEKLTDLEQQRLKLEAEVQRLNEQLAARGGKS